MMMMMIVSGISGQSTRILTPSSRVTKSNELSMSITLSIEAVQNYEYLLEYILHKMNALPWGLVAATEA